MVRTFQFQINNEEIYHIQNIYFASIEYAIQDKTPVVKDLLGAAVFDIITTHISQLKPKKDKINNFQTNV